MKESLVANGCYIGEGAVIENSIIGLRTVVGPNVTIKNSIIMGSDFYDDEGVRKEATREIGAGTVIDGAIVDKNVCVGKNVKVINSSNREQTDLENKTCVIRDGIPIIVKNAILPDGWALENEI